MGIILLEALKPYDMTAERIFSLLSNKTQGILFLEEEILSGGMGMNLVGVMREELGNKNIKYDILGIDDSFVKKLDVGQCIYDAAGIGKKDIIQKITYMT